MRVLKNSGGRQRARKDILQKNEFAKVHRCENNNRTHPEKNNLERLAYPQLCQNYFVGKLDFERVSSNTWTDFTSYLYRGVILEVYRNLEDRILVSPPHLCYGEGYTKYKNIWGWEKTYFCCFNLGIT